MKRMHIHVAVKGIEESVAFYSKMFGAEPTIHKQDYAKWQLEDPKVNFAISARGAAVGLNHLGIQVDATEGLVEMKTRLDQLQTELVQEEGTACCYAKSDKYWVNDPSGIPWETFHTLDSIPVFNEAPVESAEAANACCTPASMGSVSTVSIGSISTKNKCG
jgi:catechol 2,3-dioxygenase-like lactoylglutathione lyase family enzyme